jgi:CBS domain-containing protein
MDETRLRHFVDQPLRELPLAEAVFVGQEATVRSALEAMRGAGQSCVLVGVPARIEGIVTERDVLTKCMGDSFDWDSPVNGVMTANPVTISQERPLAEAIAIFRRHDYRTLPVTDSERVAGVLRVGDVIHHLAEAFPEVVLNLPPRPHQLMEKPEGG